MYIPAQIPYDPDPIKFEELIRWVYRLGYQAAIIDIGSIGNLKEFKSLYFPQGKSPKSNLPVSIQTVLDYKCSKLPIPLIPRITISPKSPDDLKQQLGDLVYQKVLIGVLSTQKEVLEVAARDSRVDIICCPTYDYQKTLTKGILSLARQHRCAIEFSITPILETEHFKRTRNMRMLYRVFLMAKPLSHLYVVGMYTPNPWLIRGPHEIKALIQTIFEISPQYTQFILRENSNELVLRYIKRDQELFIEPGVEIVGKIPSESKDPTNSKSKDSTNSDANSDAHTKTNSETHSNEGSDQESDFDSEDLDSDINNGENNNRGINKGNNNGGSEQ